MIKVCDGACKCAECLYYIENVFEGTMMCAATVDAFGIVHAREKSKPQMDKMLRLVDPYDVRLRSLIDAREYTATQCSKCPPVTKKACSAEQKQKCCNIANMAVSFFEK